ncbi:MAG TPA: PilZ domain-containing protein [Trebonia sp.]
MTADTGGLRYLILADRAVPYLLARVRWPDVAQAISAGYPDWLDDIGLFDLPYDPNAVPVSFTQAASVAAGWGRQLRTEPATDAPSFIRRMPANWSDMTPGERRAFGLEPAARRRLPSRRLNRIRTSQAASTFPAGPVAAVTGGTGGAAAERRVRVRVRVDGRVHIRSGQSTISAPLVDLSESGMRGVLPGDSLVLAAGDELSGPFLLEGEASKARICLTATGRISWILDSKSGTHFGVAFGDLEAGEIDGVQRFLVTAGSKRG